MQTNYTVKSNPCFGYEGKTGEELDVFLIIPLLTNISIESSRRDLFVIMVVDRFKFKKNNQIKLSPCFIFIPKTGVRTI